MHRPAGVFIRLVAAFIDGVLYTIAASLLRLGMEASGIIKNMTPEQENTIKAMGENAQEMSNLMSYTMSVYMENRVWLAPVVLIPLYYWSMLYFTTKKGGTPGKLVLGMSIVDMKTGEFLSTGQTLKREILGKAILFPLTLGIGAFAAAFNSNKRGIHDWVADSRVVKED